MFIEGPGVQWWWECTKRYCRTGFENVSNISKNSDEKSSLSLDWATETTPIFTYIGVVLPLLDHYHFELEENANISIAIKSGPTSVIVVVSLS